MILLGSVEAGIRRQRDLLHQEENQDRMEVIREEKSPCRIVHCHLASVRRLAGGISFPFGGDQEGFSSLFLSIRYPRFEQLFRVGVVDSDTHSTDSSLLSYKETTNDWKIRPLQQLIR